MGFAVVGGVSRAEFLDQGPSGREIDYAEITANVDLSTTIGDVSGLTVDVPAGDRPVLLEAFALCQKRNAANTESTAGTIFLYLYEGATLLQSAGQNCGSAEYATLVPSVRLAASASARTFKVRAILVGVGGRIHATATGGAIGPAYIRAVEG